MVGVGPGMVGKIRVEFGEEGRGSDKRNLEADKKEIVKGHQGKDLSQRMMSYD